VAAAPQELDSNQLALTQSQIQLKIAAGRYKSLDPQNCISCGDFEVVPVQNKGLIGLHAKNGTSFDFSRK